MKEGAMDVSERLADALWRVYRRPERPEPWAGGGNLPWNEPDFARRMLREHLDQSHGAASRVAAERALQIDWLWDHLGLAAGDRLLDVTCGPGLYAVDLARRGCEITGIDFSPASIAYARDLAAQEGVADRCLFIEEDVRRMIVEPAAFDGALFLYGQLAVFPRDEAQRLLEEIACALKPGAALVVELLEQERVDQKESTWWFTDDRGLWGEAPFLHLGERFWDPDEMLSIERFQIIHLETGVRDEIVLCDQTYGVGEMVAAMKAAGLGEVAIYRAWDGLPLYDAQEWNVYVAQVGPGQAG
jgi:SAM-dependent methyltransferase